MSVLSPPHNVALDLTFPQAARLRTQDQYDAVRKKGKMKNGGFFRLSFLSVPLSGATQCGFIVSRRVGNAVTRNRVKRRLRELYRQEQFSFIPDLWLIFIATPQAAQASFAELQTELQHLGKKLFLFKK